MTQPYNVAIIGFGTVGEGVYRTIEKKASKLEALLGRPLTIPVILVKDDKKKRVVNNNTEVTCDFEELISKERLDVVVEASPDADTAFPYVSQLLRKGISVVTANKELIAIHGEQLSQLAARHKCHLLFEAAVAGGIPLLNTLRHTLKTNTIQRLEGIVNGTSNFMLTKMREEGVPFEMALEEAQKKGYAEAIPDKDIDGWDAYFKTTILSQWIYGKAPTWESERPTGIRHVHVDDLELGAQLKGRIKHVASLVKDGSTILASVKPSFVYDNHPLYGVEGVNNGIHIEGSIVGSIMLQGPGAGKFPTASAIIEDLVNLLSEKHEVVKEGIEFLAHGFDEKETEKEKEDKDDSTLWFVSGKQGLAKCLAYIGVEMIQSLVHTKHKSATIVHSDAPSMERLKTLGKGTIHVYPVLTDQQTIQSLKYELEKAKTASF